MKSLIDRIQTFDSDIHAWKYFDPALAISRAESIDTKLRAGESPGLLAGVPIGVKDVFNTYEMPTGMGSKILDGYTPGNDARVVSDIRLEGGIIFGKTVTAEFAVHHPGETLNPWDVTRSPGTSSSGSAAAVAARMVPIALGTQTGGSVLRPASYCGVIGFKPSFGLVPRTGILKTTDTLDTVGWMARAVPDVRLMLEVCRVRGPNYPISEVALSNDMTNRPVKRRWRVGLVKGPKSHLVETLAQARFDEFVAKLSSEVDLVPIELPSAFDEAHRVHDTIYRRALSYYFKHEWNAKKQLFSNWLVEMIEGGLQISPDEYHRAIASQVQ
ncbi:MAG: amidase, partial [Armatimonadota bacterium]